MGRAVNLSPLGLYQWDQTIFDLMQIPEALDKPTLIDNLLSETAELEVLYPNPVVFKNLVGVWSAKQIDIWNRLYATTQYEYNPIENYDRTDSITRTVESSNESQSTNSQTAFNSDSFKDTDRNNSSGSSGGSETVSTRSHGNIGVTSSQQMIEQEREVAQFSIYSFIARSFIDRFCIELY